MSGERTGGLHMQETSQNYKRKLSAAKEALQDTSPSTSAKHLQEVNPVEQAYSVRRDGTEYVDCSSLNSEIAHRLGKPHT